jgi:hypothetical protein
MRERIHPGAAAATLVLIAAPLIAADRVAPEVLQARYVVLGYDLGDRLLSESDAIGQSRVGPQDRQALAAVREAIEKWDRWVITTRPGDADLLIAVRVGRRLQAGGAAGGDSTQRTAGGAIELSSGGDMLSVYTASSRGPAGPGVGPSSRGQPASGFGGSTPALLWRGSLAGGLSGNPPALVDQLKAEIARAAGKP